jgi:hypothetical protein
MVGHPFVPPTGFGGIVDDLATPGRGRERPALHAFEEHFALAGIEVGDHAQEQALAGARWPGDGNALAGGKFEVERPRQIAQQVGNAQPGGHPPANFASSRICERMP